MLLTSSVFTRVEFLIPFTPVRNYTDDNSTIVCLCSTCLLNLVVSTRSLVASLLESLLKSLLASLLASGIVY